jgi:hypothetical protein
MTRKSSVASVFAGLGGPRAPNRGDSVLDLTRIAAIKRESQRNLLARVPGEKKQKLLKLQLKNPVMKTMKRMLRLDKRAGFDLKAKMESSEILELLHKLMT